MFRNRKTPELSVMVCRTVPVSCSRRVTGAFGMTAPAGSNTVPIRELETVWAKALPTRNAKKKANVAFLIPQLPIQNWLTPHRFPVQRRETDKLFARQARPKRNGSCSSGERRRPFGSHLDSAVSRPSVYG